MQRGNRSYRSNGRDHLPPGYLTWNPQYTDFRETLDAPISSPYDNYSYGPLCRVPPKSSYRVYSEPSNRSTAGNYYLNGSGQSPTVNSYLNGSGQSPAVNSYLNRLGLPYRPSSAHYPYQRKINTVAEEERQRILAIRRDQEEERRRNIALGEEHRRQQRLRAEREGRSLPPEERRNERRPPPDLPIPAQAAQVISTERAQETSPDDFDWDEMLDEIRRSPPDYVNGMRNSNASSVDMLRDDMVPISRATKTEIKNAEKRKELYDRNIASVSEMAKHEREEPCSICYDDEAENMLIMVCCKQYFCFACISAWWKEKKTCPACRISDPVFVEMVAEEPRPRGGAAENASEEATEE